MPNQEKNCYLGIGGKKYGPVSEQDIQNLFDQKKITEDVKFIRAGMKEWVPLSKSGIINSVSEPELPELPPLPSDSIDTVNSIASTSSTTDAQPAKKKESKRIPVWLAASLGVIGLVSVVYGGIKGFQKADEWFGNEPTQEVFNAAGATASPGNNATASPSNNDNTGNVALTDNEQNANATDSSNATPDSNPVEQNTNTNDAAGNTPINSDNAAVQNTDTNNNIASATENINTPEAPTNTPVTNATNNMPNAPVNNNTPTPNSNINTYSENDIIDVVRNGILYQYSNAVLGNAMQSFVAGLRWEGGNDNGRYYVNASGKILLWEELTDVVVQYEVFMDSQTFQYNAMTFNGVEQVDYFYKDFEYNMMDTYLYGSDTFENRLIRAVKGGQLYDYENIALGFAIENFISNPMWEGGLMTDGYYGVIVRGNAEYMGSMANVAIRYNIDVNTGVFEYYAMEINGVPQQEHVYVGFIEAAMGY